MRLNLWKLCTKYGWSLFQMLFTIELDGFCPNMTTLRSEISLLSVCNVRALRPRHQTEIVSGAHPRGPYSLYPHHVRASMLPKKDLSTHSMHFK